MRPFSSTLDGLGWLARQPPPGAGPYTPSSLSASRIGATPSVITIPCPS